MRIFSRSPWSRFRRQLTLEKIKKIGKFCAAGCSLQDRPLLLLIGCLLFASTVYAENVQKPAVAGYFYPKDRATLKRMVNEYINKAEVKDIKGDIVAIIAPHAGYIYSGPVAGYAFKAIKDKLYKTAIIVAPSHHYGFEGLAVLNTDSYLTPLGKVPIDKEITEELIALDESITYSMQPFSKEHAAEVEIPFLQESLKNFKIVVILTGNPSYDNCILLREALTKVAKGRDGILLVASSDMSHYYPHTQAQRIDNSTLSEMRKLDPESLFLKLSTMSSKDRPCGSGGIIGIMMAARNLGADKVKILKYATSGDVTGDRRAVVGYSACAIYKSSLVTPGSSPVDLQSTEAKKPKIQKENEMESLLNIEQKKRLLEIARETIETHIKERRTPELKEDDPVLNKEMGAFVTLHKHGQLRGCIGNMVGKGPLYLTVQNMAIAASTEDPRFSPVTKAELKDIDIEISVLSPMEKIDDPDKIIMGKHGVMVKSGFRSGVYLPQVATETGWSKNEFMNSLCLHKAGLPVDSWKKGICDIYIFTAEVFGEQELTE